MGPGARIRPEIVENHCCLRVLTVFSHCSHRVLTVCSPCSHRENTLRVGHIQSTPRTTKNTQPKPGARLVGSPRGAAQGPRERNKTQPTPKCDWLGAPRTRNHTAEATSAIGRGPPGAAQINSKSTQPIPRARLAGSSPGPPSSTATCVQQHTTETRSASPGCRQNRRDPANAKTQGRNHEDDWQRPPGEAHAHKAPENKNTHSRSQEHDWLGTPGAGHIHSTRERKNAQPKSRAGLAGGSIV